MDGFFNFCCHDLGYWRRECIANLTIGRSFSTGEFPLIGKSLNASCHAHGEFGHPNKSTLGGTIGKGFSIHTKLGPCFFCSGWSQVGTAMFFGSAHKCGSDFVGFLRPFQGSLPAIQGHQIHQSFSHGRRTLSIQERHWRIETTNEILAKRDNYHAWSELGNSIVRGIQKEPVGDITQVCQLVFKFEPIILKNGVQKTPDIFKHDSLGLTFFDNSKCLWKKITLIGTPELLAGFRKWRTWNTASQKIDSAVFLGTKITHILFKNPPIWAVCS